MPEENATNDKALALQTEIGAVTTAIEVYLGTRELIPDYDARATRAITSGQAFTKPPTDDTEQETILQAQRAIASLRKEAEKAALAYRAPLNAGAKAIIAIEKAAEKVLVAEEERLAGLINHFQRKLADDRRRAEAEAEKERQRIAHEQAEAERLRKEAEEAQRRAEAAAGTKSAAQLAQEAAAAEDAAFAAEIAAQAQRPVETVPISDHVAREYFDFEILGDRPSVQKANLIKLLCAHSEFFDAKIKQETPRSISLTLKISDLCDALNGKEPFKQITQAPGILITKHLSKLR